MKNRSGWTRVDLLAVILLLTLLSAVLVPGLAKAGSNSHSFQCLANLKQLMTAMLLYSHENHDLFPPNPDDGNSNPGYNWCGGQAGVGASQEFNSDILRDPSRSLLAAYLQNNATLFKCPADARSGKSTAPSTLGQMVPAARTVSMNQAVGTSPYSGGGQLAVDGAWLDGSHGNTRNGPWRTYGRTTAIVVPSPSLLFVLLDENPLSLNDASFAVSMVGSSFIDWPGVQHNFGGCFAFADGRAELHRWKDNRTELKSPGGVVSSPGNPDIAWIQARTSAHK